MIELLDTSHDDLIAVRVGGKLTKDDYEKMVPILDRAVAQHERVRMLIEMEELEDVGLGAVWEDLKADVKHYNNVSRMAVVGRKDWHETMTAMTGALSPAESKFFEPDEITQAYAWLERGE